MHRFSKHFELFGYIDPQYRRYNFEKTSPLMCMIKFGPSHEGSPGCAVAAVYFGLMWNNVDNHSPPYADTVIGPNSQQWVGSQDEWLSHTLKEPIFDLEANELQNLKPLASQLAVCTCSFSKREAQFTFRTGRFMKFVISDCIE
ncbi:hypothetical protein T12_9641 [Trichinella patagoniensis]|uniref:Uncharacterized protein n=1 Tax=Trichinella patagoniensis TaxID=990121 RepID=A0A0V1A9U5_9BILA|nr:hypothetical protein T12_9641 [Trichinella patagoniensis]